jgi:hypothetical protein
MISSAPTMSRVAVSTLTVAYKRDGRDEWRDGGGLRKGRELVFHLVVERRAADHADYKKTFFGGNKIPASDTFYC